MYFTSNMTLIFGIPEIDNTAFQVQYPLASILLLRLARDNPSLILVPPVSALWKESVALLVHLLNNKSTKIANGNWYLSQ